MSKNRGNSQRIQHRRGSAAEWTVNNPILFAGELGYETDTTRIKVGDGVTQWVNLGYVGQFGASNLDGLTDVSITSPSSGAVLRYDGTSWIDAVLSKSDVGLSNVDNTSDANKPVSTAQAAADAAVASAASSDATSKANAAQAAAIQRANHTGTQPASTITGLATVATSGSYNDLSSKPTIPSAYTLPAATTTTLGGVIVGTGLGVSSGTVSVTYGTTSGSACQGNDARLSDARIPTSHTHTVSQVTDAGTIATQNANSVAITGGSINGTTIGATTASTGRFTTVEAAGADAAILVGTGSYGRFQLSGGNATGFLFGSFAALGDGVHLAYNYYANAAGTGVITNAGEPTSRVTVGYGFVAFATSSAINTAPTERMRINPDGNVGIGTTSPNQRLAVSGNISCSGIIYASTGIQTSGARALFRANNEQYGVGVAASAAGGFVYFGANNGTATPDAVISGAGGNTLMTLQNGGNVGIGTASPVRPLHVNSTGFFAARITSTDPVATVVELNHAAGTWELSVNGNTGTTGTAGTFYIWQQGVGARMVISPTGNVGIGTVNPETRLHVTGTGAAGYGTELRLTDNAATGNNGHVSISAVRSGVGYHSMTIGPSVDIKFKTGGDSTKMVIDGLGNVGIGTTSPGSKLHVAGSNQGIYIEDTGANRAVLALLATNNELRIQGTAYVNALQPLTVWTANAERMRITSGGDVGIGTNGNPSLSGVGQGVGVHVAGSTLRLDLARTPASSAASGNPGEICWDSSFLYICTAVNTWRRIAHSTW